jgi:hypothetical protein
LSLVYPHREQLPMRVRVFIDFLVEVAQRRIAFGAFDPQTYAA